MQTTINTLSKQLQETGLQLKETLSENQRLHLKLEKSMAEGSIAKKHLFGSKSQKGISPKKQADNGREKDRDEFDGTDGSLNSYITSDTPLQSETPGIETDQMNSSCSTTITFSRKGWRYRKMNADEKIRHASCNLLSYLAFNKYPMETPLYREIVRLLNERMHISRMTLTNWFEKGVEYLKALLPVLKKQLWKKVLW